MCIYDSVRDNERTIKTYKNYRNIRIHALAVNDKQQELNKRKQNHRDNKNGGGDVTKREKITKKRENCV